MPVDLTDRDSILREVKARVRYLYGKTDGTCVIPGELGGGAEVIKLAYRAACLNEETSDKGDSYE